MQEEQSENTPETPIVVTSMLTHSPSLSIIPKDSTTILLPRGQNVASTTTAIPSPMAPNTNNDDMIVSPNTSNDSSVIINKPPIDPSKIISASNISIPPNTCIQHLEKTSGQVDIQVDTLEVTSTNTHIISTMQTKSIPIDI